MFGRIVTVLLALATCLSAHAQVWYVTDQLTITMRTGPANDYKIKKLLPSGSNVTLIKEVKDGYVEVEANGEKGFVLKRYLIDTPPSKVLYPALKKRMDSLNDGQKGLLDENKTLVTTNQTLTASLSKAQQKIKSLNQKLERIERASSNVIELDNKAQKLQEENITLRNQLDLLSTEAERVQNNELRKWYLYGALTLGIGLFLGIILPALRPKKRSSSW